LVIALSVLRFTNILITPLVYSNSSYKTSTKSATRGAGTAYPSGAHSFYIIFME